MYFPKMNLCTFIVVVCSFYYHHVYILASIMFVFYSSVSLSIFRNKVCTSRIKSILRDDTITMLYIPS
jgi:hypothetical protein